MRKALVLLVVFAAVGAVAFADGPVATWGVDAYNGVGVVMSGSSTSVKAYDYSWVGGGGMDVKFQYTSADGNAGLRTRLRMSPAVTATGAISAPSLNQFNAFGKFFGGMLTVRGGIGDDYTIATPVWNDWGNTDGAFGLYFDLAPIAGLDIGYFQPIPAASSDVANLVSPTGGKNSIVGLAYTMKDIGSLVAGAILTSASSGTQVYFGGKVTAVKDLSLSFEGDLTLGSSTTTNILVNAGYTVGGLTIGSYIGAVLASTVSWGLEPTVAYKINDNLTANVIVNLYSKGGGSWMSPIDGGAVGAGTADFNFGAGASVVWAASGASITLGDFFSATTAGDNAIYVNADLSL